MDRLVMTSHSVVRIGRKTVGPGRPVYVIAESGINHNGSLEIAKRMIDGASAAGCDAVKFQKRTPELATPRDQWHVERDTPWGRMSYIEYRHRLELSEADYEAIDAHCKAKGIDWFASCWDEPSVDFIERFDPPAFKIASASVTDLPLLEHCRRKRRTTILSSGMSTMAEIDAAVATLGTRNLLIAHAVSTYPCPVESLNLRMIDTLQRRFPGIPIGYSGHEEGLAPTWAAVALGAAFVERHITLDRAMWGSDQAASIEIADLARLVAGIRDLEKAMGDGLERVLDCERPTRLRLRRVRSEA